jgi:hypothetical protein|tara:strand:+ start:105 stop:356 length:252 start_codon:yes stop_codon:yes gene_type:complete
VYVEVAELRKRLAKMRLHADKGQVGTPRGRAISEAEAEDRGQEEGVRAALERTLQQLQLKDRRCIHLEAEADRIAEAKTKVST